MISPQQQLREHSRQRIPLMTIISFSTGIRFRALSRSIHESRQSIYETNSMADPRMIYFDPTWGGGVEFFNLCFIDNLISNDLSTTCPNLSTGDKSRQALLVNLNSLFRVLLPINHIHKTRISQWELFSIDDDKIYFISTREGERGGSSRIYPTGMASSPRDYQKQFIRNLGKIS